MIDHVSVPAPGPQHVAKVLAELMNGKCVLFGPIEGAFLATSGDANGTMIEIGNGKILVCMRRCGEDRSFQWDEGDHGVGGQARGQKRLGRGRDH